MFAIIIIPVRLSAKVSNQELRNRDGLPVWLLGALFLMGASSYPRHTGYWTISAYCQVPTSSR
jgi:hypothetical protein